MASDVAAVAAVAGMVKEREEVGQVQAGDALLFVLPLPCTQTLLALLGG